MLSGRTIVVTGAARGVGRAIARACARHHARLVLGDVLEDAGRDAAVELGKVTQARFVPLDLDDPDSIARFADDIAQREGEVHGLVNNAAIATDVGGKSFDEIDLDLWDRVMRVNVRGTWLITRALAPLFAEGGDGRIVNIASDTALWGAPRLLAYVASKGAVISMTRSLARELGPRGIGVTVVAPGILRANPPITCRRSATGFTRTDGRCRGRKPRRTSLIPWSFFSLPAHSRSPARCFRSMRDLFSHEHHR